MATTEVISGEQRLLSRVLKKRAKGSLMEEQLSQSIIRIFDHPFANNKHIIQMDFRIRRIQP